MKDFFILKVLDVFQEVYKKLGVNYSVMRMIVQVKLTMDGRRVSTIMQNNGKGSEKKEKNNYLSLLIFNLFMSIFISLILISDMSALKNINIVIGVNLFMMVSFMISDFSAVLLDVKEKNILLSKPLDGKTFNAAKTTHIALYMLGISLSLNLLPLIFGSVKYGIIFAPIFFVENILLALIVIVITALLYTLVLKFFDGEKLKDIINYFQIFLAFAMSFGYQLFNRIFIFDFAYEAYNPKVWHAFLPSMWFAAPFGLILDGEKNSFLIFLSILALVGPILLIIFYMKKVVPYFEENLQKLNNNGETSKKKIKLKKEFISKLICRDEVERSMFIFTKRMIVTERNFKLKVYPSLAMAAFMPLFFAFTNSSRSFIENIQSSLGGKFHFLIYISILMLCFCTAYVNNSDSYKGAFIYRILPIKDPGLLLKGAVKGILFKIIIPIYLAMSLLMIIIKGPIIIMDLIVMLLVLIISALMYFKMSNKALPFSVNFAIADSGKLIGPALVTIMIIGALSIIHIIVRNDIKLVIIFALVLLVVNLILWKISFKVSFKNMKM